MSKQLVGLAAVLCFITIGARAVEGNPLKNAKVGDFASFKMSNKMGGMAMEMENKRTVIKKTDTEVTIEVATKVMGNETKFTYTVKLDEKFDPREMAFKGKGDVTIKDLDKGEETITVAGKSLKTTWTSYEITHSVNGRTVNMKGKTWFCPDVPLGGVVKSESEMGGMGTMTMELVDYGSK